MLIAALATLALLAATGPTLAGAQDPTAAQYDDTGTRIVEESTGTREAERVVEPLPFTGLDLVAMAAVAVGVAGLGLALGRAVRRHPGSA